MRPLQLTMHAFGPYKNEVSIDFTQLKNQQLFLITGPTGAGKTTIFDAIVYALYGETSGTARDKKELKSQYADVETVADVTLKFLVQGKTYTIYRELSQKRVNRNGKLVDLQPKPKLEGEEAVYIGEKQVRPKIQELIGLDVDQFRQIVMLPQGEFKKLLLANSKEKSQILATLFHTEKIQQFQKKLEEQAKANRNQLQNLRTQLDKQANALSEYATDTEIQQLHAWVDSQDRGEIMQFLGQIYNNKKIQYQETETQLRQREKQKRTYERQIDLLNEKQAIEAESATLAQQAEQMADLKQQLNFLDKTQAIYQQMLTLERLNKQAYQVAEQLTQLKQDQAVLAEKEKQLQQEQLTYQADFEALSQWRDENYKWEQQIEAWKRYQDQIDKLAVAKQTIQTLVTVQQAQDTQLQQLASDLEANQAALIACEAEQTQYAKLADEEKQVELVIAKLQTSQKQLRSAETLAETITKLTTKFNTIEQVYQTRLEEYTIASKQYYADIAGVLAEGLVEGEVCPVCGSVHHPQKAIRQTENVDEETVEALKDAVAEQERLLAQTAAELKVSKEKLTEYLAEVEQATVANWQKELAKQAQALNAQQMALKTQKIAQVKNAEKITALTTAQANLKAKQQESLTAREVNKSQQQTTAEQIATLQTESETLKASLWGESLATAQAEKQQLATKIQKTEQQQAVYNEQQQQLHEQILQKNTQKAEIQKRHYQIQIETEQVENALANETRHVDRDAVWEKHQMKETVLAQRENLKHYEEQQYALSERRQRNEKALPKYLVNAPVSSIEEAFENVKKEVLKLHQARDEQFTKAVQFEKVQNDYLTVTDEYIKQQQDFGDFEILDCIANGRDNQYQKISFERFVLGRYFDHILTFANERLLNMTQQRFEFKRITTASGGNQAKGLDLAVFDYQTGEARSVHSLSGGESFKASLALALGMSDVIQNTSGGVHVETLFIDEGFGTLDNESLQTAVEALIDLQATSGRLIGIISHVEELKQQIPLHLTVDTTVSGSTAAFKTIE